MVFLLGLPRTLYFKRSAAGAGSAVFDFASGTVATLDLPCAPSCNGGKERTVIVSKWGRHIIADNNTRVSYHRSGGLGYGNTPSFY